MADSQLPRRQSLPPITALDNLSTPPPTLSFSAQHPEMWEPVPSPPAPPPIELTERRAPALTEHRALAVTERRVPAQEATSVEAAEALALSKVRSGFTANELLTLARTALEINVYTAKHGEKKKKWAELGGRLRQEGMVHSDAVFQRKVEDLLVWQDNPARATLTAQALLKPESASIPIAAVLDRLSQSKADALARTDAEQARAVKKYNDDQRGGQAIRDAALRASRGTVSGPLSTAHPPALESASAAQVKRETVKRESLDTHAIMREPLDARAVKHGPPAVTTVKRESLDMSAVKRESLDTSAVKRESLDTSAIKREPTAIAAIKREPLAFSPIKHASPAPLVKMESTELRLPSSDIELIDSKPADFIELDSDGEVIGGLDNITTFVTGTPRSVTHPVTPHSVASITTPRTIAQKENTVPGASRRRTAIKHRAEESDSEDESKPGPSRKSKRQRKSTSLSPLADMQAFMERESRERRAHEARMMALTEATIERGKVEAAEQSQFHANFLGLFQKRFSAERN